MLLEHQGQKSFKALPLFKEFCSECVGNICFCNVSSRRNFKWFPKQTRQKQGYLQCFHKTTCKKIKNVFKQNSRFFQLVFFSGKINHPLIRTCGGYWVLGTRNKVREAVWAQKCFAPNKHALRTCHALYLQNAEADLLRVHPEGHVFALTKADGFE